VQLVFHLREAIMAKLKRRSRGKGSRRGRRVAPEIAGIQALLAQAGPQVALNKELFEREAQFATTQPELSAKAIRARKSWTREGASVAKTFLDLAHGWDRRWDYTLPDIHFPSRELLHVFGADSSGQGGDAFYALEWMHRDPFAGTGSFALANRRTGALTASHYTTSGWLSAYAGVGVRLVPKVAAGVISVRPYVNWSGNDLLQHRVFDPQLNEQRWGVAQGSIGIIVQSSKLTNDDFRTDAQVWVRAWRREQLNPQGASDHDGTISSSSGLTLDVPVTSSRRYSIWVACRASAFADPGFAVATRSNVSMNCSVPFVVVEEIPA
jgi:hypothetical protein